MESKHFFAPPPQRCNNLLLLGKQRKKENIGEAGRKSHHYDQESDQYPTFPPFHQKEKREMGLFCPIPIYIERFF